MVTNVFQGISIVRLVYLFVFLNKEKPGAEVEAAEIDKSFIFYELLFYQFCEQFCFNLHGKNNFRYTDKFQEIKEKIPRSNGKKGMNKALTITGTNEILYLNQNLYCLLTQRFS